MDSRLKEKTAEVGVNYDAFIEGLRTNRSDMEMATDIHLLRGIYTL
ncbi:MAG: hypothetical protein Q8911_01125 [Bacillota bacterium]|nr:hypothetical protein [Bacillota bacterium]